MELGDTFGYAFGEIRDLTHRVVEGLDSESLLWRPDAEANSIAWLVWHLTRVADDHVSEIADHPQVWDPHAAGRFGLPSPTMDTGYGHTPAQVAAVRPDSPAVLLGYHDDVAAMVQSYLQGESAHGFARIIDDSYDPPVTVAVRLVSVLSDAWQHLGQAGYVRGLRARLH